MRRAIIQPRGLVLISLAALLAVLSGCGGGGAGITAGIDAKVVIPQQTIKLVDNSGRDTGRTLTAPAVQLAAGQEAAYSITASDMAGVAGASLRLNLDSSVLTCTDATTGPWVGSAAQTMKNAKAGAVAVASTAGAPAGSAVVATFQLKALASATSRTAAVTISGVLVDDHGQTLGRTSAVSGMSPQQAGGTTPGDLMGDHQPNVGSAIKILRVVVGLDATPPAADLWLWDCNGNGSIDVSDAIKILRCVVSLDPWPINPNLDPALVGTWQPVSATKDGAPDTLADVEGWAAGQTNDTKQFGADGTFTNQPYSGTTPGTPSVGTWTASGGSGKIVVNSVTKDFTYAISGNVMTFTRVYGGHTYVQVWVKIVTLTEHDPAFVKTWRATSATQDGVSATIANAFHLSAPATDVTVQFFADGTLLWRTLNLSSGGDQEVDRQTGTWATGGGTFTLQYPGTSVRGAYSGAITTTNLGGSGESMSVVWSPFAPAAAHAAAFVGTWQPTSGTSDGISVPIVQLLKLDPPADHTTIQFWADGTAEMTDYAGTTATNRELRSWSATATAFTIVRNDGTVDFTATYTMNGSTSVTLQGVIDGHNIVLNVTRLQ